MRAEGTRGNLSRVGGGILSIRTRQSVTISRADVYLPTILIFAQYTLLHPHVYCQSRQPAFTGPTGVILPALTCKLSGFQPSNLFTIKLRDRFQNALPPIPLRDRRHFSCNISKRTEGEYGRFDVIQLSEQITKHRFQTRR